MKKWSLNAKVYGIVGVFFVACATVSVLGIFELASLNKSLNYLVNGNAARISNALELQSLFLTQSIYEKTFILEDTREGMKKVGQAMDQRHEELLKLVGTSMTVATAEGRGDLEKFRETYEQWWEATSRIRELALAGRNQEAFDISKTSGKDLRQQAEDVVGGIVQRYQAAMTESVTETDAAYARARNGMIGISSFAVMLGLVLAFFVMRSISRAIDGVIRELADNSTQVTSASLQIASSSQELSQAATEQAASLEETASAIEEMNSMVQKNAENARQTADLASSSKGSAVKGKEVVHGMIRAIDDINTSNASIMDSINESNQRISEIVNVISEIGNRTKVINDIVFQTKLLSFNASVEAARAGEHGKGFAVVAEEVGNLAQMSGNAAKEISSMLESSIERVQGIVDETKRTVERLVLEGKSKVEAGTRVAQECGIVLDEIVENVDRVTHMAHEISTASQEQAQGVQEITKAMSQLDQVTQTNAATSGQSASAAEQLSAQAEALRSMVSVLVETIKGSGAKVESESAAASEGEGKSRGGQVVSLRRKPESAGASADREPLAKVAGGFEVTPVPRDDDPRFQDF